jgi:hypothetical protein
LVQDHKNRYSGSYVSHIPLTTRALRANGDSVVTTSPAQERLWFVYQMEENKALYNSTCHVRVSGKLGIHLYSFFFQVFILTWLRY